jgi:nicotinamidase-related amidase
MSISTHGCASAGPARSRCAGIQTNFCCETTARIGSDVGYDVWFVLDATHTFDIAAPDGEVVPAEIARMTGINLQDEFAEVVTTAAACT